MVKLSVCDREALAAGRLERPSARWQQTAPCSLREPPSEVINVNQHKLKMIVEYVRANPVLGASNTETMWSLGLMDLLPLDEREAVRRELDAISEAEAFMVRVAIEAERWA